MALHNVRLSCLQPQPSTCAERSRHAADLLDRCDRGVGSISCS